MGDINKRRGRVLGLDQKMVTKSFTLKYLKAEITKYAIDESYDTR